LELLHLRHQPRPLAHIAGDTRLFMVEIVHSLYQRVQSQTSYATEACPASLLDEYRFYTDYDATNRVIAP